MPNQISKRQNEILESLNFKSQLKLSVFNVTLDFFIQLKEILSEMSNDISDLLDNNDRKIRVEYRDRGKYEAELKFADDVLIFSMHSDIFKFDRDHPVWKTGHLQSDSANGYCGIISIYNFLTGSLKDNRSEDLGYLVARLFVNKDKYYLVEGKRQQDNNVKEFGTKLLTREQLVSIVESAILYTLSFDLLVPPFDLVKVASVEQINDKIESSKLQTGKRVGYKYCSDDVLDGKH